MNELTFGKFTLIFVVQGTILKAWIDVTSGKDAYARKAGKYFDEGLKERADVFALMGKVRWAIQITIESSSSTTAENIMMLLVLLFPMPHTIFIVSVTDLVLDLMCHLPKL